MSKHLTIKVLEKYLTAEEIISLRGEPAEKANCDFYGYPIVLPHPLRGKGSLLSKESDDHYITQSFNRDFEQSRYVHLRHAVVLFIEGDFKGIPFYATFRQSLYFPDSKIQGRFSSTLNEVDVHIDDRSACEDVYKAVANIRSAIRKYGEKTAKSLYELDASTHEKEYTIRDDMAAEWVVSKIQAREHFKRNGKYPHEGLWDFDTVTLP